MFFLLFSKNSIKLNAMKQKIRKNLDWKSAVDVIKF